MTKGGLKVSLIAAGAGAAAMWITSMAASKVSFLASSPYIAPGLLVGGGALAAMKGKTTVGVAAAAVGGGILAMTFMNPPSPASGFADREQAEAGMLHRGDAGALGMGNASPGEAGMLINRMGRARTMRGG